jgi:hypothetical protein
MARKTYKDDGFADLVKRLNEMSNTTPEQERQALLEAARQEPRVLDDRQITLADIAKLAGIKEFKEPTKISPKAEKLIESITGEKSDITKAIEESDKKAPKKAIKEAKKKQNRLETIAELEAKLAELKAEQKEEQTYDAKAFRDVVQKDMQEYIQSCDEAALVELYNSISNNEAIYNEESSNILVKTEETKEIIADAEKLEQEVIKEKEKVSQEKKDKSLDEVVIDTDVENPDPKEIEDEDEEEDMDSEMAEASGYQGQDEAHAHIIKLAGDFSPENPVTDADAETIKQLIFKRTEGVLVDVTPYEGAYDSVVIHSMRPKQAFIDILDDVVDESAEVTYTDELSENMDEAGSRLPSSMAKTKAKLDKMTPDEIRAFFKNREDFAKQASGGTIRPGYSAKELAQGQEFRYGREFAKGRPYSRHFENTQLKK